MMDPAVFERFLESVHIEKQIHASEISTRRSQPPRPSPLIVRDPMLSKLFPWVEVKRIRAAGLRA